MCASVSPARSKQHLKHLIRQTRLTSDGWYAILIASAGDGTTSKQMIIERIETGLWTATHNGQTIGGIYTQDGDGCISQHVGGGRTYQASFRPNPEAEGLSFEGNLRACKKWLNDWASFILA